MKSIKSDFLVKAFKKNLERLLLLCLVNCFVFFSCEAQRPKREKNLEKRAQKLAGQKDKKSSIPQVDKFQVVFPLNQYLTTNSPSPYPVLVQSKVKNIDTRSFVNVMSYGARGDGTTVDDKAITAAFLACKDGSGVIFPSGKTFLIKNLQRIPLDKSITVYAYGATIKMAANTGYNALAFESVGEGFNNTMLWLGGTLDGNKDQQSWPGSPTKNDKWVVTQGNYGLLTIRRAKFALIKDITVKNSVYDGVDLFECQLGVFADSKGEAGVPLTYSDVKKQFNKGKQATYFKVTRIASEAAYFLNLDCTGGSIGVQYSTDKVGENSLAVVSNCRFNDQSQDAIHMESCKRVFIDHCTISAANATNFHADTHISSACVLAVITNNTYKFGKIDFRNASSLQYGVIKNCQFTSTENNGELPWFIHNATHVIDSKFTGITSESQVVSQNVSNCTFENFNLAVNGAQIITNSKFQNGNTGISNPRGAAVISESEFTNLKTGVVASGKAISRLSVKIYKSNFSDIKANPVKARNLDSLVVQESSFTNFGIDGSLNSEERKAISGTDEKTRMKSNGQILIDGAIFKKSGSQGYNVPFDDAGAQVTNTQFAGVNRSQANSGSNGSLKKLSMPIQSVAKAKIGKPVAVVDNNGNYLGQL